MKIKRDLGDGSTLIVERLPDNGVMIWFTGQVVVSDKEVVLSLEQADVVSQVVLECRNWGQREPDVTVDIGWHREQLPNGSVKISFSYPVIQEAGADAANVIPPPVSQWRKEETDYLPEEVYEIELSDEVYQCIADRRRDHETMGQALKRLMVEEGLRRN